jgi:putative oxidoreductase
MKEKIMSNRSLLTEGWTPRLLGVLRIVAGFLFTAHGTQKLVNFPASEHGGAPLMSFMGFAGTLEVVGGILILGGLFTRPMAFILSGMMAVAYFMAHAPDGLLPIVNKGELAVLYSFIFLFMSAAGGGSYSIDNMIGRSVVRQKSTQAA